MSKAVLLAITVVMTAAITGLTFLIPSHNAAVTCFVLSNGDEVIDANASDSAATPAVERGFPLKYYQEPFPSNCTPANEQLQPSGLKAGNLAGDLLMWTPLAFLISLGINKVRIRK